MDPMDYDHPHDLAVTPKQVTVCLYHDKCTDGLGSAFAVWWFAKSNKLNVKFYGISVSQDLTALPLDNEYVVMCDISSAWSNLEKLLTRVKGFMLIDHHKTAQQDLEKLPADLKIFDMNHSGASLTWSWFFPGEKVPEFIELIEDRDIWTNKYKRSKYFYNWMSTVHTEDYLTVFSKFEPLVDSNELNKVLDIGKHYETLSESIIAKEAGYARLKLCKLFNKFYIVGTVNSVIYQSDIGNRIMINNPLVDFAAVFSVSEFTTNFSLRSTNERTDISEIAKLYGGGGHRNAAGLQIPNVVSRLPGIYSDVDIVKTLSNIQFKILNIDEIVEETACNVLYETEYKVISVHSTHDKKMVLSYLDETVNNKKRVFSTFERLGTPTPAYFDVLLVWNYDPVEDVTKYLYVFGSELKQEHIETFKKKYGITDPRYFELKGLTKIV